MSIVPLILHSHDHSGTVQHGLEWFSTVMVFCVNEYRTIPNRTGPAHLLLPCCMVQYGTVEQKCAESHTILAILGTTWSKDHLRLLLDSCASINMINN